MHECAGNSTPGPAADPAIANPRPFDREAR